MAVFIPVEQGYEAYIPDLPGLVGTASSIDTLETLLQEAVPIHLKALAERSIPKPTPQAFAKPIPIIEKFA
jgi:predicted RNase H-like HicB family nuclease